MSRTEIEAKFYVPDLDRFRELLERRGATRIHPRRLERNWRFDLPDRSLTESGAVLRVRVDPRPTLTLKRARAEPLQRDEIEIQVDDAARAIQLLEALGYQSIGLYEKYRQQYSIDGVAVMLDELPFGNFVELEGDSAAALKRQAEALGLDWTAQVSRSYLELFAALRAELELGFGEATFSKFQTLPPVTTEQLGLRDAAARTEHIG